VHLDNPLRYCQSQSGTPLLAGDGVVRLLELLKQLGLIGGGDARTGIANRDIERSVVRFGLDDHFAGVGELDGVADQIDQHLRQAPAVAVPRWQFRGQIELEREFLVDRQRLERAADGLSNILNRIGGEFECELAGLDLG
jgi:hypothetical protein